MNSLLLVLPGSFGNHLVDRLLTDLDGVEAMTAEACVVLSSHPPDPSQVRVLAQR
jgi:hypothetical protein